MRMLPPPPPFLILPQAEINFNYFPSVAHYECQDNEALTLNKYVALGMCLLVCRKRDLAGLGLLQLCYSITGVLLPRYARAMGCFPWRTAGYSSVEGLWKRSIPSPVGRQHALHMNSWK